MRSALPAILALALAGCDSGAADNGDEAGAGVTIPLTTVEANAQSALANAAAEPARPQDAPPAPAAKALPPPAKKAPVPKEKPSADPAPEAAEPAPAPEAAAAPAPAATPAAPTDRGTEKVPLPEPVIARTIERIGYPCGSVVSSARVDGGSGGPAYRITCSSGASYRASTVRGRLRFRRWDRD